MVAYHITLTILQMETGDRRKDSERHVLAMSKRILAKYGLTKKTQLKNSIKKENVLPVQNLVR